MRHFNICYPDANNFNKVIKFKPIDQWQVEYVPLAHGHGYWVAEHPFEDDGFELFKEVIGSFPIQKDNNHPDNRDPNPFDTIHVPEWVSMNLCFLIRDFYIKHVTSNIAEPQIHEWGNVYFKERSRPISCWRIPHIDYVYGLVANLWFTDHELADSSTRLYHYHGKMHGDIYDFQVEETHPLHAEWKSMSDVPSRLDAWHNPTEDELSKWGFEFIGETPTRAGTMTMYKANLWHNPFISQNVDFRWSHAFAFSHEAPQEMYFRDILK